MATIENIFCEDWQDFKSKFVLSLYNNVHFEKNIYIFRGQRSANWRLQSSFDRWFSTSMAEDRQELFLSLMKIFKEQCDFYDLPEDFLKDEIWMIALAQHYGLPTRMLDWSESPYIAAFYAFSEAAIAGELEDDCAIWAIDKRVNMWGAKQGADIIELRQKGNIKIRNQSGIFTLLHTSQSCLEEYVDESADNNTALYKFTIPTTDMWNALADLDAMGINHQKLFPGLNGCAIAAKLTLMNKLEARNGLFNFRVSEIEQI